MKKSLFLAVVVCLFLFAFVGDSPDVSGGQVDYVRVCDSYGAGFEYIPGLEICWNAQTGEAVAETDGGEWRSILPYPVGQWVSTPASDCKGKISHVGTFKSTDFTENSYDRGETYPVSLPLDQGSFISKVFMSGGFYAPPGPPRGGSILEANGSVDGNALCLRSKDPDVTEYKGNPPEPFNPPYGNYGVLHPSKLDSQGLVF